MSKISIAMLLALTYNAVCVDRVIPEKLGILTSLPHTLLSGAITGDSTMSKQIPLTQGKFAIVDDEDCEWLNQWKWCAHKDRETRGIFYAVRNSLSIDRKKITVFMHRQILGLMKGDGKQTDHCNHNGLDNRKRNIRTCTNKQNKQNQRKIRGTSRYKGVYWNRKTSKWHAQITYNRKKIHIGYFEDEIKAAKTYDKTAEELFGKFANVNFN